MAVFSVLGLANWSYITTLHAADYSSCVTQQNRKSCGGILGLSVTYQVPVEYNILPPSVTCLTRYVLFQNQKVIFLHHQIMAPKYFRRRRNLSFSPPTPLCGRFRLGSHQVFKLFSSGWISRYIFQAIARRALGSVLTLFWPAQLWRSAEHWGCRSFQEWPGGIQD